MEVVLRVEGGESPRVTIRLSHALLKRLPDSCPSLSL